MYAFHRVFLLYVVKIWKNELQIWKLREIEYENAQFFMLSAFVTYIVFIFDIKSLWYLWKDTEKKLT